ncbi:MAG: enoyl-CoA hydratase/isomerase family protein [Limisphaerales bacterium]
MADVTVASDLATFRAPELLRGIADTNYAQILPRQVGPARARDLLLTGRTLKAKEAVEWGLVARVVPHDQLLAEAEAALAACCRTAPGARRHAKRIIDAFYGDYERTTMDDSLAGPEAVEGYEAFRDRRSPEWVPPALRIEGRL